MTFEEAVQSASAIVYSMQGYAVAIRYEDGKNDAPLILLRARDADAYRLVAHALSAQCNIVESDDVAMQLCVETDPWDPEIPYRSYETVADILTSILPKYNPVERALEKPENKQAISYRYIAPLLRRRSAVTEFELQLAPDLAPLTDEIADRVDQLRERMASDDGYDFATLVIRFDSTLDTGQYRALIQNIEVAAGRLNADAAQDDNAPAPVDALMTHLARIIRRHGAEWITAERVREYIQIATYDEPGLMKNIQMEFETDEIRRLIRELAGERVPIGDGARLFSTLWANRALKHDFSRLFEAVRKPLIPVFCSRIRRMVVLEFDPDIEAEIVRGRTARASAIRAVIGDALDKLNQSRGFEMVFAAGAEPNRRALFENLVSLMPEESDRIVVLAESELLTHARIVTVHVLDDIAHVYPLRFYPDPIPPGDIPRLTEPAERRVNAILEKWRQSLSARHIDRDRLSAVIRRLYEIYGAAPPRDILFCAHPFFIGAGDRMWCHRAGEFAHLQSRISSFAQICDQEFFTNAAFRTIPEQAWMLAAGLNPAPARGRRADAAEAVLQSMATRVRQMLARWSIPHREIDQLRDIMAQPESMSRIQRFDPEPAVREVMTRIAQAVGFLDDNPENRAVLDQSIIDEIDLIKTGSYPDRGVIDRPGQIFSLRNIICQHVALDIGSVLNADAHADTTATIDADVRLQTCELVREWVGAGGWYFRMNPYFAIVVLMPQVRSDGRRLHNSDGPAAVFADGSELYALNGTVVPAKAILAPQELTADDILLEPNAESRRVMIGRLGLSRFIELVRPTVLDEDIDNLGNPRRLYRVDLLNDEPMVFLHLVDPAKQRLGESADVFLRVPPDKRRAQRAAGWITTIPQADNRFWKAAGDEIKTCRDAVAWTFGMAPDEYRPHVET